MPDNNFKYTIVECMALACRTILSTAFRTSLDMSTEFGLILDLDILVVTGKYRVSPKTF